MKTVYLLVKVSLDDGFTQGELVSSVQDAVRSYPGSLHPTEAIGGMCKATVKVLSLSSEDAVSTGKKVQRFSTK